MTVKGLVLAACPPVFRPWWDRLEASPIGYRLAKGAFWSLTGAVISRGLALVSSIIVARMLGKVGFGELGMIQSTVGMFGTFAGFGLGLTATKHVAEFRAKDPERAGRIIALSGMVAIVTGAVMSLALFVFAPWLAEHTLAAPHLGGLLRIGCLLLFLGAVNGAQTGALSGFEAFKTIAKVNLLAGVSAFPLMVGGVYVAGLTGAVWALVWSLIINWLLNHVALRREASRAAVPFTLRDCTQELPVLWSFSLPAVLASSMVGPVGWICATLLVNSPNGYGEMGVYAAASQWQSPILFLPLTLGSTALPVLTELHAFRDGTAFMALLRFNLVVNATVALAIALPIIGFSHLIMSAYGVGYANGHWVLVMICVAAIFVALNNVVGQAMNSTGRLGASLFFAALWAVAYVGFTSMFVRHYGASGLALSLLLSYACLTVFLGTYFFLAYLRFPPKVISIG